MGNIKKLLFSGKVPKEGLLSSRLIIEWCENIHIHNGDIREEFTEEQFESYAVAIFDAYLKYQALKSNNPELINIENKYHILSQDVVDTERPFCDRLQIESQQEGHIHVHCRNFRQELTKEEFKEMALAFIEALDNLD